MADYEDTGLEPQEIKDILELFHSYRHICGEMPPDRLRELVEADQLIGKELWLTKWWTPNVRIANAPIRRTVVYFSVCKNKSILLHFKDGALPLHLIGNCAYKTKKAAEAALKGEQDG